MVELAAQSKAKSTWFQCPVNQRARAGIQVKKQQRREDSEYLRPERRRRDSRVSRRAGLLAGFDQVSMEERRVRARARGVAV